MIEADGTPLSPMSVHTFPIHVAQRYSFILTTNQTSPSYWIRAVMNTHCFMGFMPDMDMNPLNPDVLAILQYNTSSLTIPNTTTWDASMDPVCRDLNLTELIPLNPEKVPDAGTFVRVDVSFQTKAAEMNFGFMNTTSWIALNGSNILSQVGEAKGGNYSVQGVDSTDFALASQFVYSIPTIQTIEYAIHLCC
jgi:FtsP/CotA-like multicopper oxidase with cupredoxin domain